MLNVENKNTKNNKTKMYYGNETKKKYIKFLCFIKCLYIQEEFYTFLLLFYLEEKTKPKKQQNLN